MAKDTCRNAQGEKVVGFAEMVETLLQAMEKGDSPWQRPWLLDRPRNATTGICYRGINAMWLSFQAKRKGWTDLRFLTDKQLRDIGGEPKQGSGRKSPIAFWKPLEKPARKLANGNWEAGARQNDAGQWVKDLWIIREYYVWNVAQVNVDPAKLRRSEITRQDIPANEAAEALISNMAQPPMIAHGGDSAFYSPTLDVINLPEAATFRSQPEYYATKLHEVVHSTGHPSRLNRFKENESGIFGSETYSAEELVAEMCAASLVAFCGMEAPVANSAAYLRSWAARLRKDPKQIMAAAKRAEAAYDYLTAPATPEAEEGEAE